MEFTEFVRKPFVVEAMEITQENIASAAELIGVLRTNDKGTPYIQVDRRLVPNIYRVYIGFYITKLGDNVRCYSRRVFHQQFVENSDHIQDWIDSLNQDSNIR